MRLQVLVLFRPAHARREALGGIPVEVDRLGIDVCFASVQKALALPPGFSLCAVSDRALARARERKGRGYYFDFIRLADASAKAMPLATPSVSHLFALREQLRHILAEGLPARCGLDRDPPFAAGRNRRNLHRGGTMGNGDK